TGASPGHRASAQATLDAPAPPALCPGDQDCAAPAPRPRPSPCGLRNPRGGAAGAGGLWVADQHRLCGTSEPHHPSACGGDRPARLHAVQGRRRPAPTAGLVSLLLQFLLAPCELTPAPPAARTHPWHGLGQGVATMYTSHGSGLDRSCLDAA